MRPNWNHLVNSPRSLFDRRCSRRYDRNAGWSSLVARWAHNPKVGGSNPPPATKQVPDYKRLPSQPEGVSVELAHNLLTEFQPRISHLHDPPFGLVDRHRTKQVVELLHDPAVVVSDQVRVAQVVLELTCPSRSRLTFIGVCRRSCAVAFPCRKAWSPPCSPSCFSNGLSFRFTRFSGCSRMPSAERNSGSSGLRRVTNELSRSASRGEMLNILGLRLLVSVMCRPLRLRLTMITRLVRSTWPTSRPQASPRRIPVCATNQYTVS